MTIGPWTERGFFYDFDMPQALTENDLPKIRKEMQRILKKDLPFLREEVTAEEARMRIQVTRCCCSCLAIPECLPEPWPRLALRCISPVYPTLLLANYVHSHSIECRRRGRPTSLRS